MEIANTLQFGSALCIFAGNRSNLISCNPSFQLSNRCLKGFRSLSILNKGEWGFGARRSGVVKASSLSSSSSESSLPIAPMQLESPVGRFLSKILVDNPQLLPAAADQQLEQLQTVSEAEKKNKNHRTHSGNNLVLYRRIAEVKSSERKTALEEILYMLVVQKFVEADISLVPAISEQFGLNGKADQWLPLDEKVERLHSPEVFEIIQNHLALILGPLSDPNFVSPITRLKVGQVYAASILYGYFLKRVDQRFQLEKSMKIDEEDTIKPEIHDESGLYSEVEVSKLKDSSTSASFKKDATNNGFKLSKLKSYIMSFDSDTVQRYAMMRSTEAFSIIEKHTEALFGKPDVIITPEGAIDSSKDDLIKISFGGLKRLILEAVTFGSFLWEVESYAMSRYNFLPS